MVNCYPRVVGSNQRLYIKIGICCFSSKHTAVRRKSKDWLARNQNNVSKWSDVSTSFLNELTLYKYSIKRSVSIESRHHFYLIEI